MAVVPVFYGDIIMGLFVNIVKKIYENKQEGHNVAADRIVLYVPGSSVYHLDDSCLNYSTEPNKAKEKQAVKMGLRMCKRCKKNI